MRASGRDRPFLAGGPRAGSRPGRGRSAAGPFAGTGRAVRRHGPGRGRGAAVPPRNAFRTSPSWSSTQTVMDCCLGIGPRGVYRESVPWWNGGPGGGARARGNGGVAHRGAAEQERGRGGTGASSAEEGRLRPRHVSIWQSGDGQIGRPRVPCSVRVSSRTCGDVWFRQGPDTGEREPRLPSGLVKKVAKRSTWQPPVDSRPRCLGSKVSVEATSASWVVEASLSEAAIRTSVT